MRRTYILRGIIAVFFITCAIFWGYRAPIGTTISHEDQAAHVFTSRDTHIDPRKLYTVADVVDGDTFRVYIDNDEVTVRMLGVDAPETVDPRRQPECFGREASDRLKTLIEGGVVKLALNPDREKRDKYGRLLAYVYDIQGVFINEILIHEGYAREYTFGSAYQYQDQLRSAERRAQDAGLGLWKVCSERD